LTLGYLSDGVFKEAGDFGGTIGGAGGWGYRINVAHEDGDTFVDGGHIKRNTASLVLTKDIAPNLHWHFNSIYQDRDVQGAYYGIILGQDFGMPVSAPVHVPAPLPGDQRVSQPFTGYQTSFRVANTGLKWDISPDWTFSVDYSYAKQTRENQDSALILTDNQGTYTDLNYLGYSVYNYQQWQGMFNGKFETGSLKHDVVFGASWQPWTKHFPTRLSVAGTGPGQHLRRSAVHQSAGPGQSQQLPVGDHHATLAVCQRHGRAVVAMVGPARFALCGLHRHDFQCPAGGHAYRALSEIPGDTDSGADLQTRRAVTLYASYVQSLEQAAAHRRPP
jgi:iron complex outermembrane receptor protein